MRGEFRQFDGALEIGENLAASRAYGRVDATSVDTNQARRDKHLPSTDFLSAERHPELTFRSKAFEPVDDDTFRVIGDLSINGVTNEVQLTAEPGGIETGPEGEERIGLEVTGQVSRTAFAMTFLAALGSAVVADKVKNRHRRRSRQRGLVPRLHPLIAKRSTRCPIAKPSRLAPPRRPAGTTWRRSTGEASICSGGGSRDA